MDGDWSHKWSNKIEKTVFPEMVQKGLETVRIASGSPGNLFLYKTSANKLTFSRKHIKLISTKKNIHFPGKKNPQGYPLASAGGAGPGPRLNSRGQGAGPGPNVNILY